MKDFSEYKIVGIITKELGDKKDFFNYGEIYVAPGLIKHIQKHIEKFTDKESEDLYETMKQICESPQYIGAKPSKKGKSIELIKKIDNNILLAIEIDKDNNYNYVSSMYPITQGKLENRLNSSRIIKCNKDKQGDEKFDFDIKPKEIKGQPSEVASGIINKEIVEEIENEIIKST